MPFFRALAALLCLLPACAVADNELIGDLRVGAGADILHEQGLAMASVSLYPATVMAWHDNYAVALAWPFGKRKGWNGNVGLLYLDHKMRGLGTNLNLVAQISYCGGRFCLSGAHISHAAGIGIEKDKPNSGLNFVFLEVRLR